MQRHKEWISADPEDEEVEEEAVEEVNNCRTQAEKARAYEKYSYANKIAKNSIKANKRK